MVPSSDAVMGLACVIESFGSNASGVTRACDSEAGHGKKCVFEDHDSPTGWGWFDVQINQNLRDTNTLRFQFLNDNSISQLNLKH
jgi:hypothetical protein